MSNELSVAIPRAHGPRSHALHRRSASERFPIAAGFELTHRCNLACVHCYVNLDANDRAAQQRELSTDEWKRVVDQTADAGVLYLTLTGGEPLLRPDFCEILRVRARSRLRHDRLHQRDHSITERHLELWRRCPPRSLEITQYGWTRETYDAVTDAGAQYDRFQRGLERVRDVGVTVTLKAMALRANVHELSQISAFAKRENLDFRYDAILSPRIDGGRKPLAQRLTPAEVAAIDSVEDAQTSKFADYCRTAGEHPPDDRRYRCGAGVNTLLVDPYGKMHVCELSRRPGWDVLRDGLQRGFDEAFTAIRAEKREDVSGCGSCAADRACSNCTGMSELEGRSNDLGDPYFCGVTDARNERFIGAARPTPNGLIKLRLRGMHG